MRLAGAQGSGNIEGGLTDEAYWDGVWATSRQQRWLSPNDRVYGRNGKFTTFMKRCAGDLRNPSVVELGGACSYGALCLGKWWNARVTIVDYSRVGVQLTRELFALNQCEASLLHRDFYSLDHYERFDIVMHFGVLEHFPDPKPLLKLSADLLEPHGVLVFAMPNTEAVGAHLWQLWSPVDRGRHIHHSDGDIRWACSEAGLEMSSAFHFGPPMLQMSPWECRGWVPAMATMVQRGLTGMWMLSPGDLIAHRAISKYRAFVARKRSETRQS